MACPICKKDSEQTFRPFCSKRCADVDLGRWVTGSYVIESGVEDDEEELASALQNANAKPH